MEFHKSTTSPPPKNLYPCLATITIAPPTAERSRRLSTGSFGSDDGMGDNALRRVISGGRRKSSFGPIAGGGDDHKKNFAAASAGAGGEDGSGKWYWRVQTGVNEGQLLLLPLSQPPNPLLTTPPQPLSQAMPAHSHTAANARGTVPGQSGEHPPPTQEEGLGSKIKNFLHIGDRRPSTITPNDIQQEHSASQDSQPASTTATAVEDHIVDQTPRGEMIPTAEANRVGATNLNANAETGWPGTIHGDKLGAVTVDLRSVDKSKVVLGGGKKNEGSWVIVPIVSQFGALAGPAVEHVGKNHIDIPKSGSIRFDFDKDWIGAKGEAELLHYYITTAIENLPERERQFPQSESFQLGGGGHGHTAAPAANVALGKEVAPDQ